MKRPWGMLVIASLLTIAVAAIAVPLRPTVDWRTQIQLQPATGQPIPAGQPAGPPLFVPGLPTAGSPTTEPPGVVVAPASPAAPPRSAGSVVLPPRRDPPDLRKLRALILEAAEGGPARQLALCNQHITRTLERVRMDAIGKGDDPDLAAKVFRDKEVKNWLFLTWYALARDGSLEQLFNDRRMMRWMLHMNTTAAGIQPIVEVPGSQGLLWQLNMADWRWTRGARRALAAREPYCRAPRLDLRQVDILLGYLGEERLEVVEKLRVNQKEVVVKTYPAVGLLRADWLFRQIIETEISTAHYDLMYAEKRFPDHCDHVLVGPAAPAQTQYREERYTETVPQTHYQNVYDPYRRVYVRQPVVVHVQVQRTRRVAVAAAPVAAARKVARKVTDPVVDFPRDQDDWDSFWGIKASRDFLAKSRFDQIFGSIVPGSRDDPGAGSIVARNNRVTEFLRTPFGVSMRTIDVGKTARQNDFLENPFDVINGKAKAQGAELIASTPNGGFANMIVNGERKRTEVVPTLFAHNKVDSRLVDVRNPIGCITCHAADGFIILPRNLSAELMRAGVDLNLNDRIERQRFDSFMLGWQRQINAWRTPFLLLVDRTTAEPALAMPGMKPDELPTRVLGLRNRYDEPIDMNQVAHELGVPVPVAVFLSGQIKAARTNGLLRGVVVPRDSFEADVYFLLMDAYGTHQGAIEFMKRGAK